MAGVAKRFGEFARALAALANVPAQVAKEAAGDIDKLIDRQFATGTDPYERRWAPLRPASLLRGRKPPPLSRGRVRASARAFPLGGAGIGLEVSDGTAGFHNTGTSRMAKRRLLPDRALPAKWRAAIEKRYKAQLRKRLQGAA